MFSLLKHHGREIGHEIRTLAAGRYPAFVTGGSKRLKPEEIPIFVYHDIEPDSFGRHLAYLDRNGYRTLTCDEYLDIVTGRAPKPDRAVLLTIDDARQSVWTYAFPLLKAYDMVAVVFVIPGYTSQGGTLPPVMEVAADGRCGAADMPRPVDSPQIMTWQQLRTVHDSGHLDIQCHTLFHHQVPRSDRIIDYVRPGHPVYEFDITVPSGAEDLVQVRGAGGLSGLPLFESAPLMDDAPIYQIQRSYLDAVLDLIAGHGGPEAIDHASWLETVRAFTQAWTAENGPVGHYLTQDDADHVRLDDLTRAKAKLEERLPGKTIRHLCLPYTVAADRSVAIAGSAGYQGIFWGWRQGRRTNHTGDDPTFSVRVSADYITRLPGADRKPIWRIFSEKALRRLSGRRAAIHGVRVTPKS